MDVEIIFKIILLALLVSLSAFFSGAEVALIGTSKAKVNQLLKDKVRGAASLSKLKSNPNRMLATINLGTALANVGSSALATEVALNLWGNGGLAISIGIMTFILLVFGETLQNHTVTQTR